MRRITLYFCFILIIAFTACSSTTGINNSRETLVVAITADPGTLDPAVTMDNAAWKITSPAYERLVQYDGAGSNVKPELAKTWEVSADGLTWTFTLHEDHYFADGTKVDAHAVKFTFDRMLEIAEGPAHVFGVIDHVEVKDTHTVVFRLNKPFAPFLSALAANYSGIVNPGVMKHEIDGDLGQSYLANHTMGSGAYQLESRKKGEHLVLGLNEYASAAPAFHKVYFKIIEDAATQRKLLEKGDVDIAEGIPANQLKDLKQQPHIRVVQEPSLFVDIVYINTSRGNEALRLPKVRQAISYAVDYAALTETVQQGLATQMRGPIPIGLWGHDEQAKQYVRDIDKAKSLLEEAGTDRLSFDLLYSDRWPWWEEEAKILKANLAEAGITVHLIKVSYAEQRERIDQGQFDLCLGIWSPDFADPYMFMNYWFDSNHVGLAGNRAFYHNEQVNEWLRQAAALTAQAERDELYQAVQRVVIDDAPYVYLYQKDYFLPMNKEVEGFVFNPMLEGIYNLKDMSK